MNDNSFKHFTVFLAGLISLLYLVNPAPARPGLIADKIPYFGKLDEFVASALLLGSLRYFDLDLTGFFWKKKRKKKQSPSNTEQNEKLRKELKESLANLKEKARDQEGTEKE